MKQLIVKDNAALRRLLHSLVQVLAAAVYECGAGAEAFRAYAANRPDWVLMDIQLPHLDSLIATRQLTTLWPGAKVMIVTEYDEAPLRQRARVAGACAYVVKDELGEVRRILTAEMEDQSVGSRARPQELRKPIG